MPCGTIFEINIFIFNSKQNCCSDLMMKSTRLKIKMISMQNRLSDHIYTNQPKVCMLATGMQLYWYVFLLDHLFKSSISNFLRLFQMTCNWFACCASKFLHHSIAVFSSWTCSFVKPPYHCLAHCTSKIFWNFVVIFLSWKWPSWSNVGLWANMASWFRWKMYDHH